MTKLKFKKLRPDAQIPTKGTPQAAGWDLYALENYSNIALGETIETGIAVQIPEGYYGKVEARSGLSFKLEVETGAGVIDSDYRGQVKVKIYNFGAYHLDIKKGERIAQLIIMKYASDLEAEEVDELDDTERGENGFGHTGR